MLGREVADGGPMFSVEMKCFKHVESISTSDEVRNRELFEGDLGELEEEAFIGGSMLEVGTQ